MQNQELENKLIDYLDDVLTSEQRKEVEQQLESSPELQQNLEELKQVINEMEQAEMLDTPISVKNNFDQFLQKEIKELREEATPIIDLKRSNSKKYKRLLQVAAAAAILFLGVLLGQNLGKEENHVTTQQFADLRSEMLELLEKENSTSGRIKAVNISYEIQNPDDEIINALIQTMNIDASTNVRLSAIEALYDNFSNNPKVRTAFCETLNLQENPMIQTNLIKMLVNLKEKKAEKYLEDLIKKKDISPEVRDEAQMGIFKMM